MHLQSSSFQPQAINSSTCSSLGTHHGLHALAEQVHVQLLEAGAGDGGVEVDALVQRVNLDGRLQKERKRSQGSQVRLATKDATAGSSTAP